MGTAGRCEHARTNDKYFKGFQAGKVLDSTTHRYSQGSQLSVSTVAPIFMFFASFHMLIRL